MKELRRLGYDGLTIGVEIGDDLFYLTGISGSGRGVEGALEKVCHISER